MMFGRKLRAGGCVAGTALLLLCSWLVSALVGCNPVFFNQITGGDYTPLAPGDTGYVLAHVVNDSDYTVDIIYLGANAPTFYATGSDTPWFTGLEPHDERGILFPCPVSELGVGSLTDPGAPAIELSTESGGKLTMPSSAFPIKLINGVDFNCGDAVLFTIINNRNSPFMITVAPSRIAGRTQTGPFAGPDTFDNLDTFLQMTSQPPIPAN